MPSKITDLADLPDPVLADILPIVDDVAGTPVTKKVTLDTLLTLFRTSLHAVGDVIVTLTSANPAGRYGGTWVQIAQGRALVGVDTGDPDFDAAEKTAGAKTKAISAHAGAAVADHASHTHTYTQVPNHVHGVSTILRTATTGGATTQVTNAQDTSSTADTTRKTDNPDGGVAQGTTNGPSATLTHSVTQPDNHADLDVVQPSLCVFVWKKTA